MATPIFTAAVVAARAAAKRSGARRRALAVRHHVGFWDWVRRVLRLRERVFRRRDGSSA